MDDRFIQVHLADPSQRVPVPGQHNCFPAGDGGMTIDSFDAYWQGLLSDGSIVRGPRPNIQPHAIPPQAKPSEAP